MRTIQLAIATVGTVVGAGAAMASMHAESDDAIAIGTSCRCSSRRNQRRPSAV